MNFVSTYSIRNGLIIEILNKMIPICLIPMSQLERKNMNFIERLVSVGMSFTESYTSINISFDTQKRDQFINSTETVLDNQSVAIMLKYFVEDLSQKKAKKKQVAA